MDSIFSWAPLHRMCAQIHTDAPAHTHSLDGKTMSGWNSAMSKRQQKTMTSSASTNSGYENEFHYTVEPKVECAVSLKLRRRFFFRLFVHSLIVEHFHSQINTSFFNHFCWFPTSNQIRLFCLCLKRAAIAIFQRIVCFKKNLATEQMEADGQKVINFSVWNKPKSNLFQLTK